MSARINLTRPAASGGGYTPDPHGFGNSRPSAGYRPANPDDPLEKLRTFARQVEDQVEIYTQPLKPHLPAIGRFLIVVTFLEDSWRITTQWNDQLWYLQRWVLLVVACCCFCCCVERYGIWRTPDLLMVTNADTVNSLGESRISSCS